MDQAKQRVYIINKVKTVTLKNGTSVLMKCAEQNVTQSLKVLEVEKYLSKIEHQEYTDGY